MNRIVHNKGENKDEILQNTFTAYLNTALRRSRNDYMRKIARQNEILLRVSEHQQNMQYDAERWMEELPVFLKIESGTLQDALDALKEKERYILLGRVLEDKEFSVLAQEMGMTYKAVSQCYYRSITKVKRMMEEKV